MFLCSQTTNNDCVSAEAMQELKAHYITTVKKIKVDVIKRMEDMRENFRCTVHTEVMKERHSTTKKLRRYYLQCLQQFLEEDSQNPMYVSIVIVQYWKTLTDPLHITSQDPNSAPTEVNEDLSLAKSCARCVPCVKTFSLLDLSGCGQGKRSISISTTNCWQ